MPFTVGEGEAAAVRADGVVYRRMPEDRCVVLCPPRGTVRIRQDSRHTLSVATDGASVQWALGEGPERREGMVPISEGEPGSVMLVFDKGMARVVVAQSAEQAWEAPAVEVIDVAPLSTEWSGGFVGCLVGCEA